MICIIAPFQSLDGTFEQKDTCARLAFKEYPNFTERMCPRNVGGGISQRYEENIVKNGIEGKQINYKYSHVRVGSCPIPFLNPLTKLRNGRSNQSSAPEAGSVCVLARVRGLVSDSSSSGSRCRFLPLPNRAAASTAVASVEATDTGGRFSDISERLGLASGALVEVP
jgi:hypothetical protein